MLPLFRIARKYRNNAELHAVVQKIFKNNFYSKVYLNLILSTKATAIYWPDNINAEISSPQIDLHCSSMRIQ